MTNLSDGGDSCSSIKSLKDIVSMRGFYEDGLPTTKVEGVDSHFIWLGKTHTFRIARFKPFTIHFSDIPPEFDYYEVKVQAVLEAQKLILYYQDYEGMIKKRDEFLKIR